MRPRPPETETDAFRRGTEAAAATTAAAAGDVAEQVTDPKAKSGPKWWPTPDPAILEHLTPQPKRTP